MDNVMLFRVKYNDLPFVIDVEISDNTMDFWIWMKEYGVKMHCVGVKKNPMKIEEIVRSNYSTWAKMFMDEYIVGDEMLRIKAIGSENE